MTLHELLACQQHVLPRISRTGRSLHSCGRLLVATTVKLIFMVAGTYFFLLWPQACSKHALEGEESLY